MMTRNKVKLILFLIFVFSSAVMVNAQTPLTITQMKVKFDRPQQSSTFSLRGDGVVLDGLMPGSVYYRNCLPCNRNSPPRFNFNFAEITSTSGWIRGQYYDRITMRFDVSVRSVQRLQPNWIKMSGGSVAAVGVGTVRFYSDVLGEREIFRIPVDLKGKAFVRLNRYLGYTDWLFDDNFLSYDLSSEPQKSVINLFGERFFQEEGF